MPAKKTTKTTTKNKSREITEATSSSSGPWLADCNKCDFHKFYADEGTAKQKATEHMRQPGKRDHIVSIMYDA